jgi:acyl-CoA thioester hydrolase
MTERQFDSPQLPKLPTTEIEIDPGSQAETENWFEYPVKAQPHHTDYAGIVWHGTYLSWMEEARVECLRSIGIDFADLVALGCDLPVVELSLRYHRPIRLGMSAVVKTRLSETKTVRMDWDYRIESLDGDELYVTGKVTLVGIDRDKGKIVRQLPSTLQDALVKLAR